MYLTELESVVNFIDSEKFLKPLCKLYMLDIDNGLERLAYQKKRYINAIKKFIKIFGEKENIYMVSVPGRTEIGGNHTDHNNGLVFAAAVDLDILVIASKRTDDTVSLYSEEFKKKFEISTNDLNKKEGEVGTSASLIRGILKALKDRNYNIGGLDAYLTSDIPEGSGLSSSAAFEVAVTEILNQIYNNGNIKKTEIAKVSRYAENIYFEKPCGLMDQLTSCYGGLLQIDFRDIENPEIRKVNYDFAKIDYRLCIVNTGTGHSNLTDEYSSITKEMKAIANYYNVSNCRGVSYEKFVNDIPELRKLYGDRPVLRVLHFLKENKRVIRQVKALEGGDFKLFLNIFKESGDSSFKWLQNIYSCRNVTHQGITIALAIAENMYSGDAVARVHGGGFAGTIQLFVREHILNTLSKTYKSIFGNNSIYTITIRNEGSTLVNNLLKDDVY